MSMPAGAGILVDSISLSLHSHTIFDSLTLALNSGQTHCILGRSGVGKSCLLKLLAGVLVPDKGRIVDSDGQALNHQTACMFQDDGLLPWLSVVDNVQLGGRLRGTLSKQSLEQAMALLQQVGLADWSDQLPDRLSGGMRQRVALARTLMERRSVILMDEPFSRLDAISRDELQALSVGLFRGHTLIMVTHDPAEALRMAHTVSVLYAGPPSNVTTIQLPGEPLRSRDDAQMSRYTPRLWKALSRHDADLPCSEIEGQSVVSGLCS